MVMHGFRNALDKFVRYGMKASEIRDLIIVILIITLTIAFNDGSKIFIWKNWFYNYVTILIFVFISVLTFVLVQRFFSLKTGHLPRFKPIWWALLIALVLSIITDGKFWFFIVPGALIIEDILPIHRIGYFRYGWSTIDWGSAAISGPIACLILAIIFKIIYSFIPSSLLQTAILINVVIAIVNVLPLPQFAGMYLAFAHRYIYIFSSVFIILTSLLILMTSNLILIILLPIIFAFIVWVLIIKAEFIN